VEKDMKFAMKSIVAATAFVAMGLANAATVAIDGTNITGSGGLTFSSALQGALTLGGVTVGAYGGATYASGTVTAGLSSLSYDTTTNKVTEVVSTGGATQVMAASSLLQATGGSAKVGDLDVKFNADGSVNIYGIVSGTSNSGTAVNFSGLLFTVKATDITGATTFTNSVGTYNTTLSNLTITAAGFQALADVFGLTAGGLGYISLNGAAANFGTLNSTIKVVSGGSTGTVPEPSTYALMGLGLVGMGLVARRRAK